MKTVHLCPARPIFVTLGEEVNEILRYSLFSFFTEQGNTGKKGTHENLATYFWCFGRFDEKRGYENM